MIFKCLRITFVLFSVSAVSLCSGAVRAESKHADHHAEGAESHHAHGDAGGHSDHDVHARESDHGHADGHVGQGKAIVAVEGAGERFKLSEKAEEVMGIVTEQVEKVPGESRFWVPVASLVEFQEHLGVYRKKKGWYELLHINSIRRDGRRILVAALQLRAKDQVASAGAGLLRVAHLQALGQGGHGHAH